MGFDGVEDDGVEDDGVEDDGVEDDGVEDDVVVAAGVVDGVVLGRDDTGGWTPDPPVARLGLVDACGDELGFVTGAGVVAKDGRDAVPEGMAVNIAVECLIWDAALWP